MIIRDVSMDDVQSICGIYNHYIENTIVTFEEEPVSVSGMSRRIRAMSAQYPYLVYEEAGKLLGWACAGRWKDRAAYRYTAELTVYLEPSAAGRGAGSALYRELIMRLSKEELHSLIAVIALPNDASVRLHEKLGFVKTAHYPEVGFKFGGWVDVGCWIIGLNRGKQDE